MDDLSGTPATVVIVIDDGSEVVGGRVDARRPDLALIDGLARLQLIIRRRGWKIRLEQVPEDLRALVELVGLAEVLALEAGREAELGEQVGVEEVVQSHDPPA